MPNTSAKWREAGTHLRQKLATAEGRLQELGQQRAPDVLAAQLGDAPAKARLSKLDDQHAQTDREVRDIRMAIDEADKALRDAKAREAADRRQGDLAEAEKLEREADEIAQRIDQGMVQIAQDAERVQALLVKAVRLRGRRNGASIMSRVQYALRGSYWEAGVKVGDYVPAAHRRPFVQGIGVLVKPLAIGGNLDQGSADA